MSTRLLGVDGYEALFDVDGTGVLLNTRSLAASACSVDTLYAKRFWIAPDAAAPVNAWREVAECAIDTAPKTDVVVVASSNPNRAYTIPKNVQSEAKRALQWRSYFKRGGTDVAYSIAKTLAAGGQISLDKIQLIAKYFAAHDHDKFSGGWKPSDAGYPSPVRVGWSLWGGDAAARWASNIAQKTQPSITADASREFDLAGFISGDESERQFWGLLTSTSSMTVTALFTHDPETDEWMVWNDGQWEKSTLPKQKNRLVELDDESAIYVASSLYDAPEAPVELRNVDPDEFDLVRSTLPVLDWNMMELAMMPDAFAGMDATPGVYDPQERSQNAKKQVRDKNGRFAPIGGTGTVDGGHRVQVVGANGDTNTVTVRDGQNNEYDVRGDQLEMDGPDGPAPQQPTDNRPKFDTSKILGQPRVSQNTPKAWLDKLLPPMDAAALKSVITNYEDFIVQERAKNAEKFKGSPAAPQFAITPAGATPPIQAPGGGEMVTPDTTDVPPVYMAIVDRDDPTAVMELVALVPASTTSNVPTTFKRVGGAWVADPKILNDLKSATPPPVVALDAEMYKTVLTQVDTSSPIEPEGETPPADPAAPPVTAGGYVIEEMIPLWGPNGECYSLIAAGGVDRNRGKAEQLRRYWLYGAGAAKIRWNTPGDWTRCRRQLSKYLGARAAGYCALRHKEATGMWTGDKEHLQKFGARSEKFSVDEVAPLEEVNRRASLIAAANVARARVAGAGRDLLPNTPEDITEPRRGRAFRIPLVIPEGKESGDGRAFNPGALTMRDMPIPLLWQVETGDGHDGSVLVGRIDRVERVQDGLGNAIGVFDTGPHGTEAERLVEQGFLRWVSADLDKFRAKEERNEFESADEEEIGGQKMRIKAARLMAVTLVPKPAFQECQIELINDGEIAAVQDGAYVSQPDALSAAALVAAAETTLRIPVTPPREWFDNPGLTKPTALQIDEAGRIYGHIASWDIDHIGMQFGTRAPRSRSNYAYFHTGVVRTDEGTDVPVGQLTLAGGHADLSMNAASAVKHYDDTASAIADVHAGEDQFGIWVAGALRPDATPEQIRSLRASAPSGDWRQVRGSLELVAVCQVNVPGFPIARTMVASGAVRALVAAGAATLARQQNDPLAELNARIAKLETVRDEAPLTLAQKQKYEEQRARLASIRDSKRQALAASAAAATDRLLDVDGYIASFKSFPAEKRKALASEKKALPDGSFPIENIGDLKRAIRAYGRTGAGKKAAVRRHIIRRARGLDKADLIPSSWKEASQTDLELAAADAKAMVAAALGRGLGGPRAGGSGVAGRKLKPGEVIDGDGDGEINDGVPPEFLLPVGADEVPVGTPAAPGPSNESEGRARPKFQPDTQPRDARGKFRQVLARLKLDLGSTSEMQEALEKIDEAEGLESTGDYASAQKSASDVIGIVDRVAAGGINSEAVTGVREGARALGEALAHLPLPFDSPTVKMRFSDLPPVTKDLIDDLIKRVKAKIEDPKEAQEAVAQLQGYKSGAEMYNQSQLQGQLAKMLRLLT